MSSSKVLTNNVTDSTKNDAFGRLRVSEPETLFDCKLIFDKQPQFWDESLETGSGIASVHSVNTASTVFTSTLNTAGKFTRQTFMRFNYQPGKSQLILMTGILTRSGGGDGVIRRIGLFDDDNGLFFEGDEGVISVVIRTNVTGTPVPNKVARADWSNDKMDGTGPSGITLDLSKTQIFAFDFEWLGVGPVRLYLIINGAFHLVHVFKNSNSMDKVYMSTPNLPLRYQMITTGSSPVSTMECMCSSVISEGGSNQSGTMRYASTAGTNLDADIADTLYALIGIRLKSANIGASIRMLITSIIAETNDDFEWVLLFNPTVASTFTYSDQTNSSVQTALGVTANTVTGGVQITGGFLKQDGIIPEGNIDNARKLGSAIDGTLDEIVLCVRPLSSNADFQGSITWAEAN